MQSGNSALAFAWRDAKMRGMEAELRSHPVLAPAQTDSLLRVRDDWRNVVFTVAQARRALPYVARITRDAVQAFRAVAECRAALVRLTGSGRDEVIERRDRAIQRLDESIDECNVVGAHLIDFDAGLVAFRGELDGRGVSLLWQLGQPLEGQWAELLEA